MRLDDQKTNRRLPRQILGGNNMAGALWIAKCKYCGKVDDFKRARTEGPYPPVKDPESPSVGTWCKESPTQSCKFEWVRYK